MNGLEELSVWWKEDIGHLPEKNSKFPVIFLCFGLKNKKGKVNYGRKLSVILFSFLFYI